MSEEMEASYSGPTVLPTLQVKRKRMMLYDEVKRGRRRVLPMSYAQ